MTTARRNAASRRIVINPELRFWIGFVLLNILLFLPAYLLNRFDTAFLPQLTRGQSETHRSLSSLFVWRNNLDVFRLYAEWVLLAALWVFFGRIRQGKIGRIYRAVALTFYLLALSYAIYEAVVRSMYQLDPILYSQLVLVLDNLAFVADSLPISLGTILLIGMGIVAALYAVVRVVWHTLSTDVVQFGRVTQLLMALLVGWVIVSMLMLGTQLASPKMTVNSLTLKLRQNLIDSLTLYQRVHAFDADTPLAVYDHAGQTLLRKPNVYLIFVESYGSVLYKRPDWHDAYVPYVEAHEAALTEEGWHMATALSDAPVWGGGSWMAYTSALFGLRVDSHPQYLALQETYVEEEYPHFGRYLQGQGYQFTQIASIERQLKADEQAKNDAFFGADKTLGFDDLDYAGLVYGWGPAPPDQYVLNFAREEVVLNSAEPQLLFFITQNSHYPWKPWPEFVPDWRDLDTGTLEVAETAFDPTTGPHAVLRASYIRSIEYELDVLFDFIRASGDEDAIFVLVGDHQPQRVARHDDGFDTPLHIISRDADLIASLDAYGFESGLLVSALEPAMRHEGIYSLLMHTLLTQYGSGVKTPPPYLPTGLALD
jgi:phosphoglycerol transferase MdoB-like AlkP superfamily enzyme